MLRATVCAHFARAFFFLLLKKSTPFFHLMLVLGPPTLPNETVPLERTQLNVTRFLLRSEQFISLLGWNLFGISLYFCHRSFTEQKLNSNQRSSIPSKHKCGREMEILWTKPQHYFFFFGVIRNAQILRTQIRTQYLNSLLQMGRLYQDVSYHF